MPVTLARHSITAPTIRQGVDYFGQPDPWEHQARVLVQRAVFPSFAELVGLLASANLPRENFGNDTAVRAELAWALLENDLDMVTEHAKRAMATLGGVTEDRGQARYVADLAVVVTRVFGLTPPATPDASTALVDVRTDVDLAGDLDPHNIAPRVAVPLPLYLTFTQLLGLLTHQGSFLTFADLADDAAVLRELRYMLGAATGTSVEDQGEWALAILDGSAQHRRPEGREFFAAVAQAITRVLGIAR